MYIKFSWSITSFYLPNIMIIKVLIVVSQKTLVPHSKLGQMFLVVSG